MVDGSRDPERRSALDKALRDMMRAASELPVPASIQAMVEAFEDTAETDATDENQDGADQ